MEPTYIGVYICKFILIKNTFQHFIDLISPVNEFKTSFINYYLFISWAKPGRPASSLIYVLLI